MKSIFTLAAFLVVALTTRAQSFMKTTAEYNGQKYPCYTMEYDLPPNATEEVIKNELNKQGYNPVKSKGYLMYRNVRLENFNNNSPQDILFKIERKSRKESDKTLVTLISAKPGEIPSGKVKGAKIVADITTSTGSERFLNSFQDGMQEAAHNLAVSTQENEVAKAEKKLEQLQKEQAKLEKKLKDIQEDLEANKKEQEQQTEEIEKQKKILEEKKGEGLNPLNAAR